LVGLYVMAENPDAAWAKEQFGADGVALFKPVTYELFKDLGTNWADYQAIYDPKTKVSAGQQERVMALARLVTHADGTAFAAGIGDLLDLDEAARFLACEVILSNYDGILAQGQNFLLYADPRTQRLGFIPWDLDHSWGEFPFIGTAEQREQASIAHPWEGENRFLERLFAVPAFQERYRRELAHLLDTLFVPARLRAKVDELAAAVRPAIAEQSAKRLGRFETAVSDRFTDGPRDGGNPMDPNRPVWQVKRYFDARAASVRDQLAGKSEGMLVRRSK
jgi:spore coat protein CotH